MPKFQLTSQTMQFNGITLHRIQALRDIPRYGVKQGDLGGWVEKEDNLSQEGDCWVGEDAMVSENTRISGHAQVYGSAWVHGHARVFGDAQVFGNAWVYGNARVHGNAQVYGDAEVYERADVCELPVVAGDTRIFGTPVESTAENKEDNSETEILRTVAKAAREAVRKDIGLATLAKKLRLLEKAVERLPK